MSFLTSESVAKRNAALTLGLIDPTLSNRNAIVEAFGLNHKRSFDMVKAPPEVDLDDVASIQANRIDIVLVEVKSTKHLTRLSKTGRGFTVRFTDNEIDTAEICGRHHRVLIWDVNTNEHKWDTVIRMLANAANISVQRAFTYKG